MAEAAGALRLDDLGLLSFDGPDSAAFLQGYLTTDANALCAAPAFTALCNIKGRTVLTGYAWREGRQVLLLLHRTLVPIVLEMLRPYLAFSKTRAADLSDAHALFGAIGLSLGAPALNLDAQRQVLVLGRGAEAAGDAGLGGQVPALRSAPPLSPDQWRRAAIDRREVWLQAATSGAFLPQMLGLDELGALSFSKGCYLGQEVVARAQHRGQVKRRLTRLEWSGAPPSAGAEIQDGGGRRAGVILAQAASNAGDAGASASDAGASAGDAGTAGSDAGASASDGRSGSALAVLSRNATPPFSSHHGGTRFHQPTVG